MQTRWLRLYLPLAVLVALAVLFTIGLRHDPRTLPSVKINKAAPAFDLPMLDLAAPEQATKRFKLQDMQGQVWLLNVFASWCAACVDEAPSLLRFSKQHSIPLVGLAYKDAPVDTQQWLNKFGNPYRTIAVDQSGNVGIDFGVYGVPETYLIDAHGIIRYRHVGPVDDRFYEQHVLPILEADKASPSARNASSLSDTQSQASASKALNPLGAEKPAPRRVISQAEVDARLKALAAELRCLVCQNQTILDSNAGLAVDLKRQIVEQIRAGQSNEAIKDYLLERYGEFVLYNPPKTAKNLPLWVLPGLALLAGLGILFKLLRDKPTAESGAPTVTKKQLAEIEALYQAAQTEGEAAPSAEGAMQKSPSPAKPAKATHTRRKKAQE